MQQVLQGLMQLQKNFILQEKENPSPFDKNATQDRNSLLSNGYSDLHNVVSTHPNVVPTESRAVRKKTNTLTWDERPPKAEKTEVQAERKRAWRKEVPV